MDKNNKKINLGISAMDIISIVYIIIGAVLLIIGFISTGFSFSHPEKVTGSPSLFLFIFGGIGSIFLILGIIFLIMRIKKRNKIKTLITSENCVYAVITGFSQNYNLTVNGHHPYVIECSYTDSNGTMHIFKSRNIFFNPIDIVTDMNVPVYVSPDNYKNYYVDIDAILPNIEQH